MPKRLLDDSLLNSPSMAVLSPRAQDAFPRFILLADDFGCFEVHPRQLAAKGWPDRQDVSEADVASWLDEYASKSAPGEPPLAVLWAERGRRWCFLLGWNGPHGQRKRLEYDAKTVQGQKGSKRRTPAPPAELVAAVMSGERRASDGKPPGSDLFPPGNPPGSEPKNTNDSVPAREMTGNPPGNDGFPRTQFQFQPQTQAQELPAVASPTAAREAKPASRRPDPDSPQGRCFAYWRDVAWLKLTTTTPYPEQREDFIQLASALKKLSEADVRLAMDRAVADPWWREKGLNLATVCAKAAKFLSQSQGPPSGAIRAPSVTAPASPPAAFAKGGRVAL